MAKKDTDKTPLEEATEKGYIGTVPDQTPNEAYTVRGVTSGQPTPETEPKDGTGNPVTEQEQEG